MELFDELASQLNVMTVNYSTTCIPESILFKNEIYKPHTKRKDVSIGNGYVTFYKCHKKVLAVKLIQIHYIDSAQRELIATLKLIDYPQDVIVPVIHACRNKEFFIFISIGMSCDLHDIRKKERKNNIYASYENVIHLIQCITKALVYLNGLNLVHNDIKLENIVFDGTNYMLIDFDTLNFTSGGTIGIRSLQRLYRETLDTKDDIWSLSVVVYEYITKRTSLWNIVDDFKSKTQKKAIKNIQYATQNWSHSQIKFICKLFFKMNQYNRKDRISIFELDASTSPANIN